ncbi:Uncharacterised protein [uncultured archaeon]|nr:Uncharacterised protein [uncultured archaeon]
MTENSTIDEFLQKLAPCIERGELDECVEEAARLAAELGVWAEDLIVLYSQIGWQRIPIFGVAVP